jgi:ABC-2 type transport system ATP-binding protein
MLSRKRPRLIVIALLVVVLGAAGLVWATSGGEPPRVDTRNVVIGVVDGPARDQRVDIDATLYLPAPDRLPAPAILVAHGFGGSKESVVSDARELAERGFVVLAYSARGFGLSTGEIALNSPDYEVADARQLVDWLAQQDEVLTDGPNDPRIGVTGGSYGGALALMLAGTDPRVDTLAPVITYNDLSQALLPNSATTGTVAGTPSANAFADDGVFKRAWAGIFFAAGMGGAGLANPSADAVEPGTDDDDQGGAAAGGAPAEAAPSDGERGPGAGTRGPGLNGNPCGRFQQEICLAYAEVATTGRASQRVVDLLRSVSPMSVTDRITQPTLLVQGEQDTLFGLDQADANARQISAAGGPVKVIWYTGGHDGGRPGPELRGQIASWFDYHLRGQGSDPGTGFEYAVQGALRAQGAPSVRTVTAGSYPGLTGAEPTQRRQLPVFGREQTIVNPPGGNPASISNMPGLGSMLSTSSRFSNRIAIDLPGQSARFSSRPLSQQLLIAGATTARIRVSTLPQLPSPEGAVLFAKLYDVGPDQVRTLPGSAVSALRIPELPADGSPVDITVTLPGIVRPIEADHRVELVISTTDQAYQLPPRPAAFKISLADDAPLEIPLVPGSRSGTGPPVAPLIGIAVVIGICVLAAIAGALTRRRRVDSKAELADVPLVIENLSKAYPGGVVAVDDLSFRVERGQVLGLLGPNGAGKTTTLRMLMGLVLPTGGTMWVFGHKVYPGAPVLSRIGSFVEGPGFLPHLSGRENLELYWAATGRPTEQAHFTEALEIAGLGDAVRRRVRTYSQGMRQRLAIAQAMLGLPELLVLDEPTNGLDPPQIHQMREVLRRYASTGRTVLVSSHLLAEVEQTCDHVVVMHKGRLVAAGAVEVIVAGGGEVTFRVDDPEAAADVLGAVPGVTDIVVDGDAVHANLDGMPRSQALGELVRAGVAVEQAGPRRRLEDAFLQLVGEEAP